MATYIKSTIALDDSLEARIGLLESFCRGTPCLLKSRARYRFNENDVMPDKSQIQIRYTIENSNNIIIWRYIMLSHWKRTVKIHLPKQAETV